MMRKPVFLYVKKENIKLFHELGKVKSISLVSFNIVCQNVAC